MVDVSTLGQRVLQTQRTEGEDQAEGCDSAHQHTRPKQSMTNGMTRLRGVMFVILGWMLYRQRVAVVHELVDDAMRGR